MHNISYYISYLSKGRVDRTALLLEVLSVFEYADLVRFKKQVPHTFHGLLKLPYLKRTSFGDLIRKGKSISPFVKDIYGALTFIIQQNADIINRYVELKDKLDLATTVMKYEEAYGLLKQIESEVSVSMTTTYYRLKLTRLDKGINECTQLYNTICKENEALVYITSMALKSSSTDIPFDAEIEQAYKTLNAPDDIRGLFVAFAFPYKDFPGNRWMRLLTQTSIIDLYEAFILQLYKLEPTQLNNGHLKTLITVLASEIHDTKLLRLNSLLHGDTVVLDPSISERERIIIDDYYNGNYSAVIDNGGRYLKDNPLNSTIIDLYNRSSVRNDYMQDNLFSEGSLATMLCNFSLLGSLNEDFSEMFRIRLRDLCMAWYTIPCMRHLYNLYTDIENTRTGSMYHRFWSYSPTAEIRDASFYETEKESINYLQSSGYDINNSAQIAILKESKEDVFNQTNRFLRGVRIEDVDAMRNVVEQGGMTPIILDALVSQLFELMISSFRFDEAISLYVDYKLKHPFSKVYIDKNRIVTELTDEADRRIANQQELAAFYTMIGSDTYKRYLAYKRYLKQQGVIKASEISRRDDVLYLYFIGRVADRSVLMLHVRAFDTDDDVSIERIELCKKAFTLSGNKAYADEITSLIKEQEIKTLAQQVNDSKIHVDVQSLLNGEFESERLLYNAYREVDDNIEIIEQQGLEPLLNYMQDQHQDKMKSSRNEPSAVRLKMVLFRQMVLNVREKFLFDPRFGLDKYLSARIRHGALITQLRNHFLSYGLVTNKKEGGDYVRESRWTQRRDAYLSDNAKSLVDDRLLQFTKWLDEQLRIIKEERIQIWTERNDDKVDGLFNYSEELMSSQIDALGEKSFESFDVFLHATIQLLWEWTNTRLESVRLFFTDYQQLVLKEMDKLQNDVIPLMSSTQVAADFKDTITHCRTDFQNDILVVTSWFKPERSKVVFFTVRQAVDTSLSVINRINQDKLSFRVKSINDNTRYKGDYFNAVHDIFHDMMNNILQYEAKRPSLKGKGEIHISKEKECLIIEVSNPVDPRDSKQIMQILAEQQDFPALIAGGKTRRENNSGCVKIYSTVICTLGGDSQYNNQLRNGSFIARIRIDTNNMKYNENSIS